MDGYKLTAVLILLPIVAVILIPTIMIFVILKIVEFAFIIASIIVSILNRGLVIIPSTIFDAYSKMVNELRQNAVHNEIDTLVKTKQNHNKNFSDKQALSE